MSEVEGTRTSISRREVIQRGAVVGGMVWAAPAFSVLGPRAFAQTNGSPFPGDVSWVMVWFVDVDEKILYRVKYESTDQGYSSQAGVTEQQMSSNDPDRFTYYQRQEVEVEKAFPDGVTFDPGYPPDVSAGSSNGKLSISLTGSVKVYGWVLHDGSCQTGGTGFLRAAYANPGEPAAVGPTPLPDADGPFEWRKCG